jgi:hypothetical protein
MAGFTIVTFVGGTDASWVYWILDVGAYCGLELPEEGTDAGGTRTGDEGVVGMKERTTDVSDGTAALIVLEADASRFEISGSTQSGDGTGRSA